MLLVGEARVRVGASTSERAWVRSSMTNERRRRPRSEGGAMVASLLRFVELGCRVTSQDGRVLKPCRHGLSLFRVI